MSELHALSVKDAAVRAAVSVKTVRRAIESGALPAKRNSTSRRLVILVEDLDRWAFEPIEVEARRPAPRRRRAAALAVGGAGSLADLRAIERGEA